jgi:hypothetical protein
MQKHRGPILEQRTSILASPRDFSMENAKTSSRTYPLLGRQAAVPPQGDGRSAVAAWKQAFRESRNGMGGRGDFLNLLSFTITWLAVFILSNKPALAVLLVCEPPVMPGVDHGQAGINETSPDRVRRRKPASGKENPLVRSRTGLRERTDEPSADQVARNICRVVGRGSGQNRGCIVYLHQANHARCGAADLRARRCLHHARVSTSGAKPPARTSLLRGRPRAVART